MDAKRKELKIATERQNPELIKYGALENFPPNYTFRIMHFPDRSTEPIKSAGHMLFETEEERIRTCSIDSYDLCIDGRWEIKLTRNQLVSKIEAWLSIGAGQILRPP